MSFSSEIKKELCDVPVAGKCCAIAEAYGAMLNGSAFSHLEIRLSTSDPAIAGRLSLIIKSAFSIDCLPVNSGHKYLLALNDPRRIGLVFDAFGYDLKSHISYHINRNIIENECCMASYLRGVFLMMGAVASPDKKNHFELRSARRGLAGEEASLLLDLGFFPKTAKRGNAYVLYFKDSSSAESLLRLIGAPVSAEKLKKAKVEKNLRNTVNRQVNCEAANLVKAANAAAKQTDIIRSVLEKYGEDAFPEKLRETARLRLEYPDDTLSELASRFDPPLSKPGLGHRLKKIMELAAKED